jgi:hypothetical protein
MTPYQTTVFHKFKHSKPHVGKASHAGEKFPFYSCFFTTWKTVHKPIFARKLFFMARGKMERNISSFSINDLSMVSLILFEIEKSFIDKYTFG